MRERRADRRHQHRENGDQREGRQVHEAEGQRRQTLPAPADEDCGDRAGQADRNAPAGCRGNRAVDWRGEQGHQADAERAPADPHQGRQRAYAGSERGPPGARRHPVCQPPARPAKDHLRREKHEQRPEQAEQHLLRHQSRKPDAAGRAEHDPRRPAPDDPPVHGAVAMVRRHAARGRQDDRREGCGYRDVHGGFAEPHPVEQEEQYRHNHGAAADSEHAGDEACEQAHGNQRHDHAAILGEEISHRPALKAGRRLVDHPVTAGKLNDGGGGARY